MYNTYQEHLDKWNRSRKAVSDYNAYLIRKWNSVPWWKFWVKVPSFDEQRSIVISNWDKFERLPIPKIGDYYENI